MTTTMTLKNLGLTVILDKSQVVPDDPGAGEPAVVENAHGNSATYHVALHEGELDCGDVKLTATQQRWLASIEGQIGDFLEW